MMNKKDIIKKISSYIILFLIMVVVFSIAMIGTYLLPNERIRAHIAESKELLINQNGNPLFTDYIKGANLDVFTDLLIMNTAMNKGKTEDESVFIRAFENSRYNNEEDNSYTSLQETVENPDIHNNQEYSRYWHGIQTIIRPLLLFFNYEEIRYIFMLLIFVLLGISLLLINKNISFMHSMAFLVSMLAVCIFIVPMSIQYSAIFIIILLAVIIVNLLHKKQKAKFIPYLFFIIGGLTTFFDLLTAPLLTLGIPLIIEVLLRSREESLSIKKAFLEIIKLSILWAIAYGTIFFAKWVIASLIMQKDLITVAINQILFRTNGSEEYPATKIGAIVENFTYLYNNVLLACGIVTIIGWIIALIKTRKNKINWKKILILLIVSIYPYVWYMVFAGHSTIHAFFTYRIQAIAIFGVLCIMLEFVDLKTKEKINKAGKEKQEGNE